MRMKLAPLAVLAGVLACSSELPLAGEPCPCTDGFVCCHDTCVDPVRSAEFCAAGQPVIDPSLITIATGQSPVCMTTDVDAVFWTNDDGSIFGSARGGTPAARAAFALPPTATPMCGLARDGTELYATAFGAGAVVRMPVTKDASGVHVGDGQVLGTVLTPSAIAVDAAWVYVAERDTGEIKRVAKAGGAVASLGKGGAGAHELLQDEASLYWFDDGGLRKLPKTGGTPTTLHPESGKGLQLVDGQFFWVSDGDLPHILTLPSAGGVAREIVLPDETVDPSGLARGRNPSVMRVDGADLYFVDPELHRVPLTGGDVTVLFRAEDPPRILTIDAQHFVWSGDRGVYARPR